MTVASSTSPAREVGKTEQLSALTGLRFFAALQVLLFHVVPWAAWSMPGPVRSLVSSGFVAVSLFFVLSGFILTYVHATRGDVGVAVGRFYATRLARLYPVYFLGLVLVAPVMLGHVAKVGGARGAILDLAAVSTLMQSWFPMHALAWNAPGWSLSAEAFFYLTFPFIAPRVLRCSVRAALLVAGAAWVASLLPGFAYVALDPDRLGHVTSADEAFWVNALDYGPLLRLPEFVLGIALGRLYLDARVREAIRARAVSLSVGAVVVYLGTLCASAAIPYVILHNGLLAPVVAVLVVSLAAGRGPIARALSSRPLVALGDASYAMYILHVPIEMYVTKALHRHTWEDLPVHLVGYVALVIVASLACFRWFETPIRNAALAKIRARSEPRPARAAAGLVS